MLYIFGLPFGLIRYDFAGENVFYIVNTLFAGLLCLVLVRSIYRDWSFGLRQQGLARGVFRFGWTGLLAALALVVSGYFAFSPLSVRPSFLEIGVWVVLYNFCVALTEETLLRGLLLNTFLKSMNQKQNGVYTAVILSSLLFGLGHIPGMLAYPILTVAAKVAWAVCLGVFFAAVYMRSGNLWSAVILHSILNIGGSLLFYFSEAKDIFANTYGMLSISVVLGIVGLYLLRKGAIENKTSVRGSA